MLFAAVITGYFISQTTGEHQSAKLELKDYHSEEQCRQELNQTILAIHDNFGQKIVIESARCKPQ